MVCRQPDADLYLIVQDVVVFSQGVFDYLRDSDFPERCGVISLFCARCINGRRFGWNKLSTRNGMAGIQALAFPREAAYQFLVHPWDVNRCRDAPTALHFRDDDALKIAEVIGKWCELTGKTAITHSPSLSQCIGRAPVPHPDLANECGHNRADSFPGEQFNANQVYPAFAAQLQRWIDNGASEQWAISGQLWAMVYQIARPGLHTLEFGCGLSTSLLVERGCRHIAIEHDATFVESLKKFDPKAADTVIVCPLEGDPPWYRWQTMQKFDLILVDGPPGYIGRRGILDHIESLIHDRSVIFVDDACRSAEADIAKEIAKRLNWPLIISTAGHYGFACIAKELPARGAATPSVYK